MKRLLLILGLITLVAFFASYNFKNNSQFIDDLKEHSVGTLSKLEVYEPPILAPEIEFQDRKGNLLSLRSFKGQVVVVNFWATWCLPCRVEMPDLERLARKIKSDEVRVITVSLDRKGFEVIDPFLLDIGVRELEVYLDQSNRLSIQVGAIGLPTTLIIGKSGEIIARLVGPALWESEEVIEFLIKVQKLT